MKAHQKTKKQTMEFKIKLEKKDKEVNELSLKFKYDLNRYQEAFNKE